MNEEVLEGQERRCFVCFVLVYVCLLYFGLIFLKFSFLGTLQWCGDDMRDWEVSEIKVHKKKFPKNQ